MVHRGKGLKGPNDYSDETAPVVIKYGQASGYPTGAFGEAVQAPVGGGLYGAYFSSDTGFDSIAQSLSVTPGIYRLSFDIYAPANGRASTFDADFSAVTLDGASGLPAFQAPPNR